MTRERTFYDKIEGILQSYLEPESPRNQVGHLEQGSTSACFTMFTMGIAEANVERGLRPSTLRTLEALFKRRMEAGESC